MKLKFYKVDGLSPIKKSRALSQGLTVHASFDKMYAGEQPNHILQSISDEYDAAIKVALPEDVEDLIIDKYTTLGMVQFYPQNLSQFQQITPEKEFNVSLGRGLRLKGRVDGDVLENNRRWIRELKTTGVPQAQFEARAKRSYQVSGYKYALEILTGQQYDGVMYDYIRKPKLYKRVTDTAESFGKRIFDDYALTRTDSAKRTSYYGRKYIYRSNFEMEVFKDETVKLAKEMRSRIRHNRFERNPDACQMFNRECEYASICWVRHVPADLIAQNFTSHKTIQEPKPETTVESEEM